MGVPNVVYEWKSLRRLYFIVFVMNVAGFVIVVIMVVSAVKLRMGVGRYLDAVMPGDADFWPGIMCLVSFMCAPIYAIGMKLCFHLRFPPPDSLTRLNRVLFVHCVLCFASAIVAIGINVIGILHAVDIRRINEDGIMESMREYGSETIAKIRIDMMQINFQCCGSKSFKDWFHVRWMQKEGETAEDKEHNGSGFVSTDVPFSCCATKTLQTCVHHNVLKPSEVYFYQPEHRLTIATNGCQAKILGHARYVEGLLTLGLILLAAYQMMLALLSRLLQTAHSNASYIGPRKGRYLSWILGGMPNREMYDRLAHEERETIPLREVLGSRMSPMKGCQGSDHGEKDPPPKRCPTSLNAEGNSSTTVTTQRQERSWTTEVVQKEGSTSSTDSNYVPTPPPSPKDRSVSEGRSRLHSGPKLAPDAKRSLGETGRRTDPTSRRSICRAVLPKESENQLKELRESLECLGKYEYPWKGGSPMFEMAESVGPPAQSYRVNDFPETGRGSIESDLEGRGSSSACSSDYKKHKVSGKDSIEEVETRMKKFCKDLSTEYNKSPCSKQRRDFSEECELQGPTHPQPRPRDTDENRLIRSEVCAKFNPADAYSRFRGSVQDTTMRRSSQTHPGPPPIPMSDQRTVTLHSDCGPRQQYPENPAFKGRAVASNQPPKPRAQAVGPSWTLRQDRGWGPQGPPAPTYFPTSCRPPRPPRLPLCPDSAGRRPYQTIQHHSRAVRPVQFVQNTELRGPSYRREQRIRVSGMQPPRFSGC